MKSFFLTGLLVLVCGVISAQENPKNEELITGQMVGFTQPSDSVFFFGGQLASKYFKGNTLAAEVKEGNYRLRKHFNEPMMYRMVLLSDRNQLIWRAGRYFIDRSTTNIRTDLSNNDQVTINGMVNTEYEHEFIPFIFAKKTGSKYTSDEVEKFEGSKETGFDSLLHTYVQLHPSSYVALWELVNRFMRFGHSITRQEILNLFSKEIKSGYIWNTLNDDFKNILIKEQKVFPSIKVQNTEYTTQSLIIPKAKFTLVDFWFSRCKPCLESYPGLKKIFDKYREKGFNIVSISTDKSSEKALWEKRIKEYGLNWLHYLDENGEESKKLLIRNFPTTILLDSKGRVIKRDFDNLQLEKFLEKQLGK
ncbi:TlpA disulfide reductase family protein [Pedobacter nototheniae]|uniref:TlpA family protein disulfide reductase n=1 Tax=Pedobacter nototheniae TaxID=2488994 RepID=UPI0029318398|nr:TlpA disulfide reductase family protein [Pedobacter nototheniae]